MLALEIVLVLVLILVNGVLAMSEIAVVSSRPARLEGMANAGTRGAARALELYRDPSRFLSTIQIGITLVGVLSGAFSGATLGARLEAALQGAGMSEAAASVLGVGGVVAAITYLSLVIGELVPKQLGLRSPERLSSLVAPPLHALSRFAAAPIWLLDRSNRLVLRLLGAAGDAVEESITEEEIRVVLGEADQAGVLEPGERTMIDRLLALGDRTVHTVLVPRPEVELVDLSRPADDVVAQVLQSPFSRFPAHEGDPDRMLGVLDTKLLIGLEGPIDHAALHEAIVQPPELVESADARDALHALQGSVVHMALVYDEYGGFEGIVTATDIFEAIVGAFTDEQGDPTPMVTAIGEGAWSVEGLALAEDVSAATGLAIDAPRPHTTMGGAVLAALGRIPDVGEVVSLGGAVATVVDMDARRIARVELRAGSDEIITS